MVLKNMLGSRKGVEAFKMVLAIVTGIVVMIILISFISRLSAIQEEDSYNSRCRTSVLAYSRMNAIPFGDSIVDESEIDCPTRFVTIDDDRPSTMKRDVADLMFDCWRNYGEGRLRLFEATDVKFCVVCSVFSFEDTSTKLDGFTRFLMTERVPKEVEAGYRPTYYEYLAKVQVGSEAVDETKQVDMNYLDGGRKYAVLFSYNQANFWYDVTNEFAGSPENALKTLATGLLITMTGGPIMVFIASTAIAAIPFAAAASSVLKNSADWYASVVIIEYSAEEIEALGCDSLPISMVDKEFR